MEELLVPYEGKADKKKVLKIISYGDIPIKKVLRSYENDEEINHVLKEAKMEFSRIFDAIPTMAKGQNRNVIGAAYFVALYKVLKKKGYSESKTSHIFYNVIDVGITIVPLFTIKAFVDTLTYKVLKEIKSKGAKSTIEKLNYEIVDDKIKIKKEVISNMVRKENVKEAMDYMKAFIVL